MASDYVDDFLRDERELFKRKETAAKKFDNRLDNFRKSAQALRDAAKQFEKAFPGMSRTMIADKLAIPETNAEPTAAAATDPETTGSDMQADAAEPDTSDDGRPAWASGNY